MPTNYIGVTGFTEQDEINAVLNLLNDNALDDKLLMCGVVVSKARIENRTPAYPNRYPEISKLSEIFTADSRCLNLLHYRPSGSWGPKLGEELTKIRDLGGEHCHGIQINPSPKLPWPSLYGIYDFRKTADNVRVVLQVSRKAMESDTLENVIDQCLDYTDIVTDWLIDRSGGTGDDTELDLSLQLIREIHNIDSNLSLGIAGGLDPNNVNDTVNRITSLLGHTNFNIDAEGKLRNPEDDSLNIDKAARYINAALN